METAPNSFQSGFAAAGGGVWATQFDVAGILCVLPLLSFEVISDRSLYSRQHMVLERK